MKFKSISVIGLGYIGLPTAAVLAKSGYKVFGMDIDETIVKCINQGQTHIAEPGLSQLVAEQVKVGRLKASTQLEPSNVYMVCVPTPLKFEGSSPQPNIEHVLAAARNIASHIKPGDLIILESTSPVGTTEIVRNIFKDAGVDVKKMHIAYCPERVLPGNTLSELLENDRVVGGYDKSATELAVNFYKTFVKGKFLKLM